MGRDEVHLVAVKGDDAHTENIGDVAKGMVFITFPLQLSRKARLRLDAGFQRSDEDMVLVQTGTDLFEDEALHPLE